MRISDWSSDVCSSDLQKIIEIQLLRGHSLIIPTACHPRRALSYSLFRTCEGPECQTHAQPLRAPRRGRRKESHAKTQRRHVLVRASRAARRSPAKALRTVPELRSEARRAGKEGVSTCRYRWWAYNTKKNIEIRLHYKKQEKQEEQ